MPRYGNRSYVIIPATSVNAVNFDYVLETSPDTLRYSVDGTKTFIKFDDNAHPSINGIPGRSGFYSYEEILDILSGPEWTDPDGDIA